jgi:hypothetical protein
LKIKNLELEAQNKVLEADKMRKSLIFNQLAADNTKRSFKNRPRNGESSKALSLARSVTLRMGPIEGE